ncbi:MAG: type IV secretion system DNA-binding domain-containing protein [Planctomycetales bacterium]|nr:type IV secretion system DNA-binding domain-containing protein [Planctomycetales bacterium]
MAGVEISRLILISIFALAGYNFPMLRRWWKAKRYRRGQSKIGKKRKPNVTTERGLRWGNIWLPESAATEHFLCAGKTGSGKSNIMQLFMREPLLRLGPGCDQRAIFFDTKNEAAIYLRKIGVRCPIYSMNPFDAGNDLVTPVAWDVATDISSPARAQTFAEGMIPEQKSTNPFFINAPRQVFKRTIESLIRHNGKTWTFSDLIYICLSLDRIKEVLRRDSAGRDCMESYFRRESLASDIFSTIASRVDYFAPTAALWQRTSYRISITEWLRGSSIILLGGLATAKASLDHINEQVFRSLVNNIDEQTGSSKRRTWIVIDEARLAGPLLKAELLPYLCVKGRSRGVAVVIAFQDMEGLQQAAGKELAEEIVSQMGHKALLRMDTAKSAKWAADQLGEFETIEYFESDGMSRSRSISAQRVLRNAVLPTEVMQLPLANKNRGVTGYFLSPSIGAYRGVVSSADIAEIHLGDRFLTQWRMRIRPETDQWMREWAVADEERLGLSLGNSVVEHRLEKTIQLQTRLNRTRKTNSQDRVRA